MNKVYSVSFTSADATAVDKDIFEITCSTVSNIVVHGLWLGKIAAALSASAIETLAVSIRRGSSAAAAGGATGRVARLNARSSATHSFLSMMNASTPGSSTGDLVHAEAWNTQRPFVWRPPADQRPVCKLSQRLQVRLSAPAASITIAGTLLVEEIGHVPGSTVR